ncbi:MAG: hypothetical protein JWN67_2915 [Actinomycetia bacterium]|nr:hypothetical protein [Actinomycetes bacterium]
MPKLQTFDGPELDAVLAKVRREAGPDAKIVSATKVRSGGLGGFFSKEAFKVTVELADAPAAPAPVPAPAPAPAERPLVPPPASIFELADLVDEAEADTYERAQVPAPPAPAPAPAALTPTVRPPAHVPSTEKPSFNAVLRRLTSEAGGELPESAIDFVETHITPPPPAPPAPAVYVAPAHPTPARTTPRVDTSASRELLALGVPESMLPADMSPGTAVAALLRSLRLPSAPPLPSDPGTLTVVIGERRAAARLAADVAGELHLAKRDVWVAEPGPEGRPGRLVTPADAAVERRTWTGGPNVVTLTAPAGARDLRWATSMLDALEPTAVWGVVDADRKTEDVHAWAEALGGLDAVAVERLDATVSPASILRLGIPVARIEGQKATPALWAVLLAERIAA